MKDVLASQNCGTEYHMPGNINTEIRGSGVSS